MPNIYTSPYCRHQYYKCTPFMDPMIIKWRKDLGNGLCRHDSFMIGELVDKNFVPSLNIVLHSECPFLETFDKCTPSFPSRPHPDNDENWLEREKNPLAELCTWHSAFSSLSLQCGHMVWNENCSHVLMSYDYCMRTTSSNVCTPQVLL